jgi:outer membrane protein TolC
MTPSLLRTLPLVLLAAATPLGAQGRLAEALDLADRRAIANRAATGQRAARDGESLVPLSGILPAVRVEGGVVRTTDPIGVFGTRLRQRRLAAADFDPTSLNRPAPITNVGTAIVAELPILNADAWIGRGAAGASASAAQAAADWTRAATRADVVRAWYGALLAADRVTTLEAAVQAGAAHVRQAESALRNGLVTASDALLAQVKAGELEADLATARGDLASARRGLAGLVTGAADRELVPIGGVPTDAALRRFAEADTALPAAERADVRAAAQGAVASQRDAARARATLLPRINGFVRYDWNDPSRLGGGDKSWTIGAIATWTPFTGAAELAEQRITAGRLLTARAMADGAAAQATLEAARAATDLRVALQRLDLAERGVTQATDAHRIVARRYDGGLASVVELLDAAAVETHQRTLLAKARFDVIAALAARRLALGLDPAALAMLDIAPKNAQDSDR